MPHLITPTIRLHDAWLRSRAEWGPVHQPGSGLRPNDDVESAAGFATWVNRLRTEEDTAIPAAEGLVHCTYRWIVEDDELLGAISLRHTLNDFLFRAGGHIGYGIRPSARRRGLASWALGEMLGEAGKLGIDRVMISCDVTNEASARTIEKHGGVLEDIRDSEIGRVRRYWVTL
ncbi:acetyltransferase [Actinoplanes sp. OR16]|uniref:GNAT family N-acetyltransferase n=1 Tax=Actinoplanes sp. OR16 TaxID=946334 RepID=UPI000F6CDDE8|nr:GNAT family N-acetyltransferase [Actinoplanes sp. OR16]BBH71064.1 acetyltransferase [Actinoplanes sp. OR16]